MKCDFLTLTHFDGELHRVLDSLVSSHPVHREWFGGSGWYYPDEAFYLGRTRDNRFIVNVAGSFADTVCEKAFESLEGDFSVARMDLQVTVVVPKANEVIEFLRPHPRYKAMLVRSLNERDGSTLYVGAAASRKRLRLYNKSLQSGVFPPAGEFLRVELVLRDANADVVGSCWKRDGRDAVEVLYRSIVLAMAKELDAVLPTPVSKVHIDVEEPPLKKNYLWWLEHSVIPGVRRAGLSEDQEVQDLLSQLRDLLDDMISH